MTRMIYTFYEKKCPTGDLDHCLHIAAKFNGHGQVALWIKTL